jgi:AraC-like DNA-binding protein
MESLRFDTSTLPKDQQFDAWMGFFDRVFDVDPGVPRSFGFPASTEVWTLGRSALSRTFAPALQVRRGRALIGRNPIDHWSLVIGGAKTALDDGRHQFVAPALQPFLVSLGRELTNRRDADTRLQLYLSRDEFADIAPTLDLAMGRVIPGGMGRLLADYLQVLERNLPSIPPEDVPRLLPAIATMLSACVAPTADRLAAAADQVDLGRRERVRRVVRKYLRSATLGTRLLCREVGTSRSQLYRLLEAEGGVARYVRRQRLLAAYAILTEPANDTPITRIAEEFCFADGSGFSRAFRQEFDISPSELRAASRAGLRPLPYVPGMAAGADRTLSSMLRPQ